MRMLDTSSENQRAVIVRHCREHGRLNTTDACEKLGIMRLAARICELKELGYKFITYKKNTVDITGTKHRGVADYVLISEPKVKVQINEEDFQSNETDKTSSKNNSQSQLKIRE